MRLGCISANRTFGDDTWDVLVLIGVMLSASGFFTEFLGSRLNRRAREDVVEIDKRSRRFEESTRARALRLNAYAIGRRAPLQYLTLPSGSQKRPR
jgi:hypothetical protein